MTYNKEDSKDCIKKTGLPFLQKKKLLGNCYLLNKNECKQIPKVVWMDNLNVCIHRKNYLLFKKDQLKSFLKGDKNFNENIKNYAKYNEDLRSSIRKSIISRFSELSKVGGSKKVY